MKPAILIIGAGAVGLVYGRHFAEVGYPVTFLVKQKHMPKLEKGSILYHLNKDKKKRNSIHFTNYQLVFDYEDLASTEFEQVYWCISSPALQAFNFNDFTPNLKGSPIQILLQPHKEDFAIISQHFKPNQIVEGMISLISYTTPLATETVEKSGTAYWLPPMMPTPFSGNKQNTKQVVSTFKNSKISAKSVKSVFNEALYPSAFLATYLTALEISDWKFSILQQNNNLLQQLSKALKEVFAALSKKHEYSAPFIFKLISSPNMVKRLMSIAPKLMPMDIETYFEAHFTKVNAQTKLYMNNYLKTAKSVNAPHQNLEQLIQQNH